MVQPARAKAPDSEKRIAHPIIDGLYHVALRGVNAYLINTEDAVVLIDTGSPGSEAEIITALAEIGRRPEELSHIIVTHCHPDHAGSLAALQKITTAQTIMHPVDAAMVETGRAMRPLQPAPGLLTRLLYQVIVASAPDQITPARVDHTVQDGDLLDLAGGLQVLHVPGHSAGQIALYWPSRKVLIAADAVMNQPRLGYHLGYEAFALGQVSAARLADLSFDVACFGHGQPLVGNADGSFRRRFSG